VLSLRHFFSITIHDKPVRLDCLCTPILKMWKAVFPSQMESILQTEDDANQPKVIGMNAN